MSKGSAGNDAAQREGPVMTALGRAVLQCYYATTA